ncbi:hypothetical protein [Pseudomonas sp.]|uniref:hypothetical protein n=1 Tax=Pseudomonas sp. TaxID=306 RepID=UPI0037C53D1E
MLKLIAALLVMPGCVLATEERPVRFSINESWAMPMVKIEQGQAVDGILFDLQHRLAAKIGRKAELVVMPRLRVQHALAACRTFLWFSAMIAACPQRDPA